MSNERIYEYDLIWKGNADVNNAVTTGYVYSYSNTNNRIVLANIQNTSNIEFDPERFEVPKDKFDYSNTVYSLDSDTQFKFSNFDDLFVYLRKTETCPNISPGTIITQNVPDQYVTVIIPPDPYKINRVCGSCGCVGTACNCDTPEDTTEVVQTANIKVGDAYTITATVNFHSCDPPYLKVENSSGKFLPEYPIVYDGKELGIVGTLTQIEKNPYIKNYIIERPGEFYSDYTNPCTVSNEPYINHGSYVGPHVAQTEYFTGKRTQNYNDDYILVSNWDITGNNVPIGHVLDLYDNASRDYTTLSMNVDADSIVFSENVTYTLINVTVFNGATINILPENSIIGADNMNLYDATERDDESLEITLPFNVLYEDKTYSSIYFNTNGYLTFYAPGDITYEANESNPPLPKIIFQGFDLWQFRLYTKISGIAPNRNFTIRWEGTSYAERNNLRTDLSYEVTFYETHNGMNPSGFYKVEYDDWNENIFGQTLTFGAYGSSSTYDAVTRPVSQSKSFTITTNLIEQTQNIATYEYGTSGNNSSRLLKVKSSKGGEFSVYVFGNVAVKANSTGEVVSIKNNCNNIFVSTTNTTTISVNTDFNKSLYTKGYSEAIKIVRTANSNVFLDVSNTYVFHVKSANKTINDITFLNDSNTSGEVRTTIIVFSDIDRINNNVWNKLNVAWSNSLMYVSSEYIDVDTLPRIDSSNTVVLSLLKNPVENSWFGFWYLYEIQT